MLKLSSEIRKDTGKKLNSLRKTGKLPAVVYGHDVKNLPILVNYKEFERVFKEAGETTLVSLSIKEEKKEYPVIIYDTQIHPLTGRFLHVDFYQASLKEKMEAMVPLVFEGKSPAVEDLEGTLIKNITEIEIKAFPQNIPHEIKVDISGLKTFEDHILVKNLPFPQEVEPLRESDEIVASVAPPEDVEEELEKPIEEKVEEIERVGEEEKEIEEEEIEDKGGREEKTEKGETGEAEK